MYMQSAQDAPKRRPAAKHFHNAKLMQTPHDTREYCINIPKQTKARVSFFLVVCILRAFFSATPPPYPSFFCNGMVPIRLGT